MHLISLAQPLSLAALPSPADVLGICAGGDEGIRYQNYGAFFSSLRCDATPCFPVPLRFHCLPHLSLVICLLPSPHRHHHLPSSYPHSLQPPPPPSPTTFLSVLPAAHSRRGRFPNLSCHVCPLSSDIFSPSAAFPLFGLHQVSNSRTGRRGRSFIRALHPLAITLTRRSLA